MKIPADQMIRNAPAGTLAFEMQSPSQDAPFRIGFLIREDAATVKQFGEHPIVEIRCGALKQDGVLLIAVLFKIGTELYETWFNYHQTGGGEKYFRDLAEQDQFTIAFYTPDLVKVVGVNNHLKHFFSQMLERVRNRDAWTMQQFDSARDGVYGRYPTVARLWKGLRGRHV